MNIISTSPARLALGSAIEQLELAKADVEKLRQADQRAAALIEAEEAKAAELAGVDAEVAAFRARQIVENAPDGATAALPARLVNQRADRNSAKVRAEQYRVARETIVKDIAAAKEHVAARRQALHDAIIDVMCDEGDALARELAAIEARASELRKRLVALNCLQTMLPGMAQIGSMRSTAFTTQVLRNPPSLRDLQYRDVARIEEWRSYYLALAADPDAGRTAVAEAKHLVEP